MFVVYWDTHRLLHELYQKPPGFHLEVYPVIEACFSILALIYICLDNPSEWKESNYVKYSITIPLMCVFFSKRYLQETKDQYAGCLAFGSPHSIYYATQAVDANATSTSLVSQH